MSGSKGELREYLLSGACRPGCSCRELSGPETRRHPCVSASKVAAIGRCLYPPCTTGSRAPDACAEAGEEEQRQQDACKPYLQPAGPDSIDSRVSRTAQRYLEPLLPLARASPVPQPVPLAWSIPIVFAIFSYSRLQAHMLALFPIRSKQTMKLSLLKVLLMRYTEVTSTAATACSTALHVAQRDKKRGHACPKPKMPRSPPLRFGPPYSRSRVSSRGTHAWLWL